MPRPTSPAGKGLDRFDDAFGVGDGAMNPAWKRQALVFNGVYTLTLPDGSHRTFQIKTKPDTSKFAPGQRIISLLTGPDNTQDYEAFGFVDDCGVRVWKKKQGAPGKPSKFQEYVEIFWDLATGQEIEGCELLASLNCLRCNRPLTDPESLYVGWGPTCRKKTRET